MSIGCSRPMLQKQVKKIISKKLREEESGDERQAKSKRTMFASDNVDSYQRPATSDIVLLS